MTTAPDLTREAFEAAVARRLVARSDMSPAEAEPYALGLVHEYLAEEGIDFGDESYGWDTHAASEIADTDISYWESV